MDLDVLRDAGGIPAAIGGLTQQAVVEKVSAEQFLSGFNTTSAATCLQKFIDRPEPEGHTNKARAAALARAHGANLPLDILVIRWVADPNTDPNQLAAVAREVGCAGV
jgi:hypothetical protein